MPEFNHAVLRSNKEFKRFHSFPNNKLCYLNINEPHFEYLSISSLTLAIPPTISPDKVV